MDLDVGAFMRDGYVVIRGAFDAGTAAACRQAIWESLATRGIRAGDPVHVPDGFAVDGTDPAPVAQAIAAGLAMSGSPHQEGAGQPGA